MAAKYQRRLTWWVRFYHPRNGQLIRASLDTHDEAKAELLRQRIELETALLAPRFQAADIPADIQAALGLPGRADLGGGDLPVITRDAPRPSQPPLVAAQRHPLDRALQMYMAHIRSENAALHIENKVSILRRFLGDERVATVLGFKKTRGKPSEGAFFKGEFLDELTPALLQEFMGTLPVSTKTKRHYREFFHHFFEFSLKFGYFQPVNWHCPNPVAALPSYVKKNRHIVFLTAAQVDEQLRALEPYPAMHLAVAVMIFAGLRRAETLWLAPDHIASDHSYLSVVNRTDSDEDIESSLKTGARAVTILPRLRAVLTAHQITGAEGKWLISTTNGKRWRGDSFGKELKKINGAAGLPWTSLHFRHTYATQRAAEGWPLFKIAREMGNSVAVIEEYYAGYIRPEGVRDAVGV